MGEIVLAAKNLRAPSILIAQRPLRRGEGGWPLGAPGSGQVVCDSHLS